MKLSVIQCVNGSNKVLAEGLSEQNALVNFHDRCKILWNATDVITGMVAIFDEQLDVYQGHKELITHPVPEPEPNEDTIEETAEGE